MESGFLRVNSSSFLIQSNLHFPDGQHDFGDCVEHGQKSWENCAILSIGNIEYVGVFAC